MTVSEQIIQVIDALCEKFGIAIDWTAENVLPYLTTLCEKLIKYKIFTSTTSMTVSVLIIIGLIIGAFKLVPIFSKKIEEQGLYEEGWSFAAIISGIAACLVMLFCIITIICSFDILAKCIFFPELYVVEYIKTLIG
jgi:hypothetical protein